MCKRCILPVVHADEHRGILGLVACYILFHANQNIIGDITTYTGIVEMNPLCRIAGVVVIFHILRVEALVSDAVTDKNKCIPISQLNRGGRLRKFRR